MKYYWCHVIRVPASCHLSLFPPLQAKFESAGIILLTRFVYYDLLLQVVTLVGEPFVFITSMPKSGKCEDLDDSNAKRKHIRCTGKVYGEHAKQVAADENDHCCFGKVIGL